MLRVAIPPCEPGVVWLVRTAWWADWLQRQGQIEIVKLPDVLNITEAQPQGNGERPKVLSIQNLPDMDLIVFTRVLAERLVGVIDWIKAQGIKVIVDMDDDFRNLPSISDAHWMIHPETNPRYNWKHFLRAARTADWVTCSTPELQRYAPKHSTVLRNAIPGWYLGVDVPKGGKPIVGWSGTVKSHPGDLDVTRGGVSAALREANAAFVVIGDPDDVQMSLNLDEPPLCTGRLGHPQYAMQLANFDVGIVPLASNQYTRCKSSLTPLSMSALGVWWVGSKSPEYQLFYEELLRAHPSPPAGLAGPRAREWRREVLRGLRTPENERKEAVAAVKEFIRSNYTIESQAHKRLELWTQVVEGKTPQGAT